MGILLTDHQFRETLEVTDRCYLIREGRVFAYGNREQILNNADVRRHYIGERFDVGHLLDRRRPVSLPHVAIADSAEPGPEELVPGLMEQLVTTEMILSHVEDATVHLTQTDPVCPKAQQIDTSSASATESSDWD
jgi:ABC-type multidrug transport system ATPase subunit